MSQIPIRKRNPYQSRSQPAQRGKNKLQPPQEPSPPQPQPQPQPQCRISTPPTRRPATDTAAITVTATVANTAAEGQQNAPPHPHWERRRDPLEVQLSHPTVLPPSNHPPQNNHPHHTTRMISMPTTGTGTTTSTKSTSATATATSQTPSMSATTTATTSTTSPTKSRLVNPYKKQQQLGTHNNNGIVRVVGSQSQRPTIMPPPPPPPPTSYNNILHHNPYLHHHNHPYFNSSSSSRPSVPSIPPAPFLLPSSSIPNPASPPRPTSSSSSSTTTTSTSTSTTKKTATTTNPYHRKEEPRRIQDSPPQPLHQEQEQAQANVQAQLQEQTVHAPLPKPPPHEQEPLPQHLRALQEQLIENAHYLTTTPPRLLPNGWTLFPHQQQALRFALSVRVRRPSSLPQQPHPHHQGGQGQGTCKSILALDMGLGKTLIGCLWCQAMLLTYDSNSHHSNDASNHGDHHGGCCRAIVICPVSVQSEWTRTAQHATPHLILSSSSSSSKKNFFISSWGKIPDPSTLLQPQEQEQQEQSWFVVVADEAHAMQNMHSQRTQAALKLMAAPHCVGVLLLTGTPLKNGLPSNLFPLLKAVEHPLSACQKSYETHFCQGAYKPILRPNQPTTTQKLVWSAHGAAHLDELRSATQSHMLYLRKCDVFQQQQQQQPAAPGETDAQASQPQLQLPPHSRIVHNVPVSAVQQAQYRQAFFELQQLMQQQQPQQQQNTNTIVNNHNHSSSHTDSNKAKNQALLGAVQRLRMTASLAKIQATVRLVDQILQGHESAVVIFSSFVSVIQKIHTLLVHDKGWPGEVLTGETPALERPACVDRFQNGISAVFCCTFGVGGVGLTLTAAATVILVDRPWTPGDVHQAEDRIRRIRGAHHTHPCTRSIWMCAESLEVDAALDALLAHKNRNATTALWHPTTHPHPHHHHHHDENTNTNTNTNTRLVHDDQNHHNSGFDGGSSGGKISLFQMLNALLPKKT